MATVNSKLEDIEARRGEIAKSAKKSLKEFRSGKILPLSADAVIARLNKLNITYICAMTTITIQLPEDAQGKLSAIVKELGGEIISIAKDKSASKKAKLLNEIKEGLAEVKEIQRGKSKPYTMSDLFNAE